MTITHIEVKNDNGYPGVQTGQLLKVVNESPAFYWVQTFAGWTMKVSKKTKQGLAGTMTNKGRVKNPSFNL